jgi:hypothetical protein
MDFSRGLVFAVRSAAIGRTDHGAQLGKSASIPVVLLLEVPFMPFSRRPWATGATAVAPLERSTYSVGRRGAGSGNIRIVQGIRLPQSPQ